MQIEIPNVDNSIYYICTKRTLRQKQFFRMCGMASRLQAGHNHYCLPKLLPRWVLQGSQRKYIIACGPLRDQSTKIDLFLKKDLLSGCMRKCIIFMVGQSGTAQLRAQRQRQRLRQIHSFSLNSIWVAPRQGSTAEQPRDGQIH